jgi:hypothetical protein
MASSGSPSYEDFIVKINPIPLREILLFYKYIVYSDKKIHHIMYKETVNEINENLLDDFIDSEDETMIVLPKSLGDQKKGKVKKDETKTGDSKVTKVDITTAKHK